MKKTFFLETETIKLKTLARNFWDAAVIFANELNSRVGESVWEPINLVKYIRREGKQYGLFN